MNGLAWLLVAVVALIIGVGIGRLLCMKHCAEQEARERLRKRLQP